MELWQKVKAWEDTQAAWMQTPVHALRTGAMRTQLSSICAAADELDARLPPNTVSFTMDTGIAGHRHGSYCHISISTGAGWVLVWAVQC